MSKEESEKNSADSSGGDDASQLVTESPDVTVADSKASEGKMDKKSIKNLTGSDNKQNQIIDEKNSKLTSIEKSTTEEDHIRTKKTDVKALNKTNREETAVDKRLKEDDVPKELTNMFNNMSDSLSVDDSPKKTVPISSNVTTENLLSVLEGEPELTTKNKVDGNQSGISENKSEKSTLPAKSAKRYIYKLKAKSGKILKYTSSVPIVLKKPVITLTKMEEEVKSECSEKITENETDDLDSDNSTKENNVKENDASSEGLVRNLRKKGRPPLSQKTSVFTLDDRNSSDTADSKDDFKNKTTPSFTMQTRKRQLRFLPDGRVVTPGKKIKSEQIKKSRSDSSTSESDFESDEDSQSDRKFKKSSSVKKFSAVARKIPEKKGKMRKVFDFESYIREKSGLSSPEVQDQSVKETPPTSKKTIENSNNKSSTNDSSPITKKITAVDPAQLLSSLIGVPISQNQLNIVKFKPKVIQERINNNTLTPKKVTFQDEKNRKSMGISQVELLKNTPYKLVSKPIFQKILPKPSSTPERMSPIVKKPIENKVISPSSPSKTFTTVASKAMSNVGKDVSTKFDAYTDSRIVKTKLGPKKVLKQKSEVDTPQKTVYDLLSNVFDQMPSWNLHVIPDTNSFCIAQVSRGRMGIPILKKSIELNSEFFAKVYVHQLHCKRYDGVYDTENKILALIREIDALAA